MLWALLLSLPDDVVYARFLAAPERSSLSIDYVAWPPGAVGCEYTSPSGAVTRETDFPGRTWGSLALFALAMVCAWRAATTYGRRWPFAAACAALLVAAVAAFFF